MGRLRHATASEASAICNHAGRRRGVWVSSLQADLEQRLPGLGQTAQPRDLAHGSIGAWCWPTANSWPWRPPIASIHARGLVAHVRLVRRPRDMSACSALAEAPGAKRSPHIGSARLAILMGLGRRQEHELRHPR